MTAFVFPILPRGQRKKVIVRDNETWNSCFFSLNPTMIPGTTNQFGIQVRAECMVVDSKGSPVPGAKVTGSWSGLYRGQETRTTDQDGIVSFWAERSLLKRTLFKFTVDKVEADGYYYEGPANSVTSISPTGK